MSRLILETRNLRKRFGGITAVDRVSIGLNEGGIRCIVGPNGAGKTTLFNLITGVVAPDSGQIFYDGRNITNLAAHQIARLGMVRSFQRPSIFGRLTVLENVRLSAQRRQERWNPLARIHDLPGVRERAEAVLSEVSLADRMDILASELSHGERKRLELAIVLVVEPRLLLLDEPTAGMSIRETAEMAALIKRSAGGATVLVIEHDMDFVREVADTITVLHHGAVLAEGRPEEIEQHDQVREAYLGRAVR